MNYKPKTLGSRTAKLLSELNERHQKTFSLADVRNITGLNPVSARTLLHKAQRRGLVTRLKPGLFNLVPFEMGLAREYVGDPFLLADRLVGAHPYFLSHASALELHRMTTQPQLKYYVSSSFRIKPQNIHGYRYQFVLVRPDLFFGITRIWITKQESVSVSDPERTIIDGLFQPKYVGGITEIAKALAMKKRELNVSKLIEYSLRLSSGAVIRRLGFLLETLDLANQLQLSPLRSRLTDTYDKLDPLLPAEGVYRTHWRLQINVPPEEIIEALHQ